MDNNAFQPASESIRDRVRKAASTTLIGALIMLFFGFFYLIRPSGDDFFNKVALVLYHTLRLGGLAFIGIAILMFLGLPLSLLLDAILALPCGAILIACGVLMLTDGGYWLNSFILIFGGISFFPTGWSHAQEYRAIRTGHRTSDNSLPA